MRKDSGRYSSATVLMKATPPMPETSCSAQCSTVSMISPLFMTTDTPRARPTTSATPSRSRAPSMNPLVNSCSPIRPTMPMRMAKNRNSAVNSGNHQPRVGDPRDAQVTPRDHADDHDQKGQAEQDQDELSLAGHLGHVVAASPASGNGARCLP